MGLLGFDLSAGAGANAGVGAGAGAHMGGGSVGVGTNLGGLSAGVDVNLPSLPLFTFGIGGGGDAGAGFGLGRGGGAEGQGGVGAGLGLGVDGGAGGQGGLNLGGGVGVDDQGGAGIGGGIAGFDSGSGNAEAGAGGGYGVTLNPVGAGVSVQAGTQAGGKLQCTVQGGPATLLYFPPLGQQGSLDSANVGKNGPLPPSPAGGEVYTTMGMSFPPGSAYISCQTLWAGYTDDRGSVTQTGPTFANAIFPVPSDQISTQCLSTVDAKATGGAALGAQLDFGLVHKIPGDCQNIAPPPGLLNLVPEWKDYAFWNMTWEQPECIPQKGDPEPQGPVWTPNPSCSVVEPITNIVPTAPAATTSPTSVLPTSTATGTKPYGGQPPITAATGTTPPAVATHPATQGFNGSASTTGPAVYTGAAPRPGHSTVSKSSLMIGTMMLAMLVL